jgi:hypothetical protein
VTGPAGDRSPGGWHIRTVRPPRWLEFDFVDPDIPTLTVRVSIDERPGGGTRMVIETAFPSSEAMDQLLSMGFEEGLSSAVGQIDDVLRGDPGQTPPAGGPDRST